MNEMYNNEIIENTVEKTIEGVAENADVISGSGFGKKAGIVGGALVLGFGIYKAVKYLKDKKEKECVVVPNDDNPVDEVNETEAVNEAE